MIAIIARRLSRTRQTALGSVGNSFDRVWSSTSFGDLKLIFSTIASQAPPHSVSMYVGMGLVYVRGYVLGDRGSMLVHR